MKIMGGYWSFLGSQTLQANVLWKGMKLLQKKDEEGPFFCNLVTFEFISCPVRGDKLRALA